ncbi:hypothetical protein JW851_03125 [Candidatus Woesearchaeota archaeon]|nr:hypothetical protein [Candidatus Woesearchaeota archaeon]
MSKIKIGLGTIILALSGCIGNPMKEYYGINPSEVKSQISEQTQTIEGKIIDIQNGLVYSKEAGPRMYKYLDIETKDGKRYWLLSPDSRPYFKNLEAKINFKEIFDGRMSTTDFKRQFMVPDEQSDGFETIITAKGVITGVEYQR